MHDLNEIHSLVMTVREGSFSKAASKLGVQKSTLSRRVSSLEERLGVQLLMRTTRKLILTEAGEEYFHIASRLLEEFQALDQLTSDGQKKMRGRIRITAPVIFGDTYLTPILSKFICEHPEIDFDLVYDDRVVDLVGERFDFALRAGELEDSTLKARRIGTGEFALFASPDYLEEHRKITKIQDVEKDHRCIIFMPGDSIFPWHFTHREGKRIRLRPTDQLKVNTLQSAFELARTGAGIALLPLFHVKESMKTGELIPVMKEWTTGKTAYHLVHPPRKYSSPAIQAFEKFLVKELRI